MIYELTISRPKKTPIAHWSEVPWLKDRKKIAFEPGLNIVFGPNGSGKSTLLLALATLMHCRDENWPKVTKDSLGYFNRPLGYADGMTLVHDGKPCRYLGLDLPAFEPKKSEVKQVKVELESTTLTKALDRQSSGQQSITKLVRFLRGEPQKVKYVLKESQLDEAWQPLWDVATAALENVESRPGIPKQQTLLLDEVDRSLDFAKQAAVWKQIRNLVADGKHQVIIASHSPFAVSQEAHYIETTDGYLDASRKALSLLLRDTAREAA